MSTKRVNSRSLRFLPVQRILRDTDPRITTEGCGHPVPGYLRDAINKLALAGAADLVLANDDSGEKKALFCAPVVRNLPAPRTTAGSTAETVRRNPAFLRSCGARIEPATFGL
jgi:hypothetical protein